VSISSLLTLLRFVRFLSFVSDGCAAVVAGRDEGKGNESVFCEVSILFSLFLNSLFNCVGFSVDVKTVDDCVRQAKK
jgi:hypothetical protein